MAPSASLKCSHHSALLFAFHPQETQCQDETRYGLSHIPPTLQEKLDSIISDHWLVFDKKGVLIPVKNYECVIDTSTEWPIAVKKILYGKRKTMIMQKCITALAKVGHIQQSMDWSWLFKALLAPKPHQEHIKNIDDFVCCFCVNYIPLNSVTCIVAYPILQWKSAVFTKFSMGWFIWMFDAPTRYHQLAVAAASQEKLTFQEVDAIKWTYMVMSIGPTNGLAMFVKFIYHIEGVSGKSLQRVSAFQLVIQLTQESSSRTLSASQALKTMLLHTFNARGGIDKKLL
jgi:hypothetical protein